MTEITFMEAMRLKAALGLTPDETCILVSVLERGRATRDTLMDAACSGASAKCLDVKISKLNKKLPATIRIHAVFDNGRRRRGARGGTVPADGYQVNTQWGYEHLFRMARSVDSEAATERAA